MGGASNNHVTFGHVKVWEASSSLFDQECPRDWTSTSALLYEKPVNTNHLELHQTYVSVPSAIHHFVLGATIALLFSMVWDNYYGVPYM